jgi:hypothetical protein
LKVRFGAGEGTVSKLAGDVDMSSAMFCVYLSSPATQLYSFMGEGGEKWLLLGGEIPLYRGIELVRNKSPRRWLFNLRQADVSSDLK